MDLPKAPLARTLDDYRPWVKSAPAVLREYPTEPHYSLLDDKQLEQYLEQYDLHGIKREDLEREFPRKLAKAYLADLELLDQLNRLPDSYRSKLEKYANMLCYGPSETS